MIRRSFALGVAALALFAGTTRADDTIKLGLKKGDDAPVTKLVGDGEADTVDVGYYRGARWGGWNRVGWGWGGWGWGGWPRWYGAYYPYYPRGYYSSYVYYPSVYYYPPVYYYPSVYYYPVSLAVVQPYASVTPHQREVMPPVVDESLPAPRQLPKDGTYQYDGGPANPVPIPNSEAKPRIPAPRNSVAPLQVVSLNSQNSKYRYSAYGEKPARPASEERMLAAKPNK